MKPLFFALLFLFAGCGYRLSIRDVGDDYRDEMLRMNYRHAIRMDRCFAVQDSLQLVVYDLQDSIDILKKGLK